MATTPDSPSPERPKAADMAAAALSLLLLLAAAFVLLQFPSRPWLKQEILGTPIPLAVLATLLVLSGSIAVLTYTSARQRRIWTAAVVLFQLAIAALGLLVMQDIAVLVFTPAHGDFGDIANLGLLIIGVFVPAVVAIVVLVALMCLIAARRFQKSVRLRSPN